MMMIRSIKAHVEFNDVRGKTWRVKRSMCRHYYASSDGVNYVRCKLASIATVLAMPKDAALQLILGAI